MNLDRIVVDVRDTELRRVGRIAPEDLDLDIPRRLYAVGEWTATLPATSPMAGILQMPGTGIIVSIDGQTFQSGHSKGAVKKRGAAAPAGTVTVGGLTDNIVLSDALAWADPLHALTAQAADNDTRTGPAETLMYQYTNLNIGPGALASRRGRLTQALTMAPNQARGQSVTKSPRYQQLLELLTEIGTLANLAFEVVQVGEGLQFSVYERRDLTRAVRLNVDNGLLESTESSITAPEVTRVIVAGQGVGRARQLIQRQTPDSIRAENEWGRIIERFKDQRQTDNVTELQQAGDEELAEGGATSVSLKAAGAQSIDELYHVMHREGDFVSVLSDGIPYKSYVSETRLKVNEAGAFFGIGVGDLAALDVTKSVIDRILSTTRRISNIERSS